MVRMLGVNLTANHKSETQVKEIMDRLENILDTYNSSPVSSRLSILDTEQRLDMFSVPLKFLGLHSDHAEDQKSKYRIIQKWKEDNLPQARGARYFHSRTPEEQKNLKVERLASYIREHRGFEAWESLSEEEKNQKMKEWVSWFYGSFSEKALSLLTESEKQRDSLFIWMGCCMHKDLNATKGGNLAMQDVWKTKENSSVPLANKDNSVVIELATAGLDPETIASSRARDVSIGGAAKLLNLMGALFNNKDDKKGFHNTYNWYMNKHIGCSKPFPEVSNTRYSSLLEAACVVFENKQQFIELLYIVRDSKVSRTLNNIEANILKGLEDPCTLSEIAVFVLYYEAVSLPFIRLVHGSGLECQNGLDLGPLFLNVKEHIKKLIEKPSFLTSSSSSPSFAILYGSESIFL